MPNRPIQEQFGEALISALKEFARADLESVPNLEQHRLDHLGDAQLRKTLAETLYGARWIYKLGLALLVKDVEQLAHVRAQVIDYGSVCEGLLHDMIVHAIFRRIAQGQKFTFGDIVNRRNPLAWPRSRADISNLVGKQSFYWRIAVAEDEQIIDAPLSRRLHSLRKERNTVHLHARTYQAFLGTSRSAFQTLNDAVDQTRAWKQAHP